MCECVICKNEFLENYLNSTDEFVCDKCLTEYIKNNCKKEFKKMTFAEKENCLYMGFINEYKDNSNKWSNWKMSEAEEYIAEYEKLNTEHEKVKWLEDLFFNTGYEIESIIRFIFNIEEGMNDFYDIRDAEDVLRDWYEYPDDSIWEE